METKKKQAALLGWLGFAWLGFALLAWLGFALLCLALFYVAWLCLALLAFVRVHASIILMCMRSCVCEVCAY